MRRVITSLMKPSSASDPDFASVVLLLDFAGNDGDTNITDLSNSGHVDTFNDGAEVDTALQFLNTNSVLLDGVFDAVSFPDSADWDFGTADFTIEFGARLSLVSSIRSFISNYGGGSTASSGWVVQYQHSDTTLKFFRGDTPLATETWAPVVDTWYHIAVSREGTNLRLFVDGVQLGSTTTDSSEFAGATQTLVIGGLTTTLQEVAGNIAAVRVTKGVARYTANFTPPTVFYPTS